MTTDEAPDRPIKIAVFSHLDTGALDTLRQRYDCVIEINPEPEAKQHLLADAEIVIIRSPVRLAESDLRAAGRLRLIVRAGAGLDTIDVAYAKRAEIRIEVVPLSGQSVAEHIFGLILALYRKIPSLDRALREGRWEKHSGLGFELHEKTIGLLGLGRIGRATACLAHAFGMRILAFDRSPDKKEKQISAETFGIEWVDLERLFDAADILSIQCPLTDKTRSLVDAALLGRMQKNAILVNVGRGGVVDEEALFTALTEQRIFGAALDVFSREPAGEHPLLTLNNFVGTPHVGAQTVEAQQRVGRDVVRAIEAYAAHRTPLTEHKRRGT